MTLYIEVPEFRHLNYKLLRPLVLRPNQSLSAYTPCGRIVTEKQIKSILAFFLANARKARRGFTRHRSDNKQFCMYYQSNQSKSFGVATPLRNRVQHANNLPPLCCFRQKPQEATERDFHH